jgi:streptogramin lyase
MEGLASGNDSLPEVLPASINLTGPFAPVSSDPWLTITGITNGVVSFAFTAAASNRAANIALLGQTIYVIQGGPVFSLGTGSLSEGTNAGSDSVFLTVLPPGSAWTNTANANWLHLSLANQTGSGSTNVVFTYDQDSGASRTGTLTIAGQTLTVFQQGAFTYSLGTSSLVVGPAQGSNSVVFAVTQATRAWTATNNAAWLHLSPAYQNGAGSENVVFSYDANSGPTRYGTLTIGNQVLTVTQAGSTYVAAGALTTLVSSGLSEPWGVAVDTMGNVYFSDTDHDQIDMWVMTNNSVVNVVPTTYGWSPSFVAVNSSGIPYSCNYDPGLSCDMIVEWNGPSELVNFLRPTYVGLALDGMDNVYFPNIAESAIMEYTASNGNVSLVVSNLALPIAVALDAAGNIYVAEDLPGRVAEWNPQKSSLATLPISGVSYPLAVAVDGSGAVYIDDAATYAISKWTPANGTTSVLLSAGLNSPQDVAVDGAGNLYVADTENNAIKELPYAFVDPTPRLEGLAAASDALPPVLPTTENLLPPFAPTSDQSWLAITGITNGVVSFSFSANTGPARTANITLLGQTIPITQGVVGTPPMLTGVQVLTSGALQFAFTNNPSGSFTVLSTTDLSLPLSSWTVAGTATNNGSGMFQFTSQPTTNDTQLFYAVRSP